MAKIIHTTEVNKPKTYSPVFNTNLITAAAAEPAATTTTLLLLGYLLLVFCLSILLLIGNMPFLLTDQECQSIER